MSLSDGMSNEAICGLCGNEATGLASIARGDGEVWYCHGDEDLGPTCYERATWGFPVASTALQLDRWTSFFVPGAVCHCGQPVRFGYDGDPTHHRGMCDHCDSVRCDAHPGDCGR